MNSPGVNSLEDWPYTRVGGGGGGGGGGDNVDKNTIYSKALSVLLACSLLNALELMCCKTHHGFYKMLPLRKWGHSCQITLAVSLDCMTFLTRINLFCGRGLSDTHEQQFF